MPLTIMPPPTPLASALAEATGWRDPPLGLGHALPAGPGAYALVIALPRAVRVTLARLVSHRLAPGFYVYAGSARGPGGIAARLSRHLKAEKTLRWHVDQLTMATGAGVLAWPSPDRSECDIVAALAEIDRFSVPVAGFGSSDCRTCKSHLLAYSGVPAGTTL